MTTISVIISYYKSLNNLKIILKSLNNQSVKYRFEVMISEDDFNQETIDFVRDQKKEYSFKLLHQYQKVDNGFRKNQMLNKSIQATQGELLVFIDGDCVPHYKFIEAYHTFYKKGVMMKGRRVMLGSKISQKLSKTHHLGLLKTIQILFSDSDKKKEALSLPFTLSFSNKVKGLLGCNWGIDRESLLAINGFDEDYIRAAVGEDTDVEWRLKANGVGSVSMKNKAIVYHIHHARSYSNEGVNLNRILLKDKIKEDHYFCLNGILKNKNNH